MSEAMFYQAIGNSIQANKDKIEKLEKQNARLKKKKKVLQQENKQLKENNMSMQEEMARTWKKADLYKEVIYEIREYVEKTPISSILEVHCGYEEEYTQPLLQILDKVKENK